MKQKIQILYRDDFYEMAISREMRMKDLKEELIELERKLEKYEKLNINCREHLEICSTEVKQKYFRDTHTVHRRKKCLSFYEQFFNILCR